MGLQERNQIHNFWWQLRHKIVFKPWEGETKKNKHGNGLSPTQLFREEQTAQGEGIFLIRHCKNPGQTFGNGINRVNTGFKVPDKLKPCSKHSLGGAENDR